MRISKRVVAVLMAVLVAVSSLAVNPVSAEAKTLKKTGMNLTEKTVKLYVGEKLRFDWWAEPCYKGEHVIWSDLSDENSAGVIANNWTFKSSKPSVAKISKDGTITAKKKGTTKITVKSKVFSELKATFTVKVTKGKQKNTLKAEDIVFTCEGGTAKIKLKGTKCVSHQYWEWDWNHNEVTVSDDKKTITLEAGNYVEDAIYYVTVRSKINPKIKIKIKVISKACTEDCIHNQ